TYTWLPGQGFTATYPDSAVASPTVTTTYTVVGTDACGSDTATFTVQVNPAPVVVAPSDTTICAGSQVTLTANGNGNFQWSGGSNAAQQTISVNPIQTTAYYITVTQGTCPSQPDTVIVNVITPGTASITGTSVVCSGGAATLIVSGGSSYAWQNGVNSTNDTVIVFPTADSTYTVIASQGICQPDTLSWLVTDASGIVPSFEIVQSPCSRDVVFVNTTNGGIDFEWSFGDGNTEMSTQASHNYDVSGVYDVTLYVNPNSLCEDSVSLVLDYQSATASDIWIPNAFTPGNDTKNETFILYGPIDCHYSRLLIFDRWGQLIWSTNAPMTDFWDGRVKGTLVQQGVYVYRLEGQHTTPKIGSVTVFR
ncbi:MAG: gliding motility-associated C-terminal domain-containing protein, partial [Bacteroidia bacterium]